LGEKQTSSQSPSLYKGIAAGLTIGIGINLLIPYTRNIIRTTSLVESTIPMGVLIPFLILVFILNPLLASIRKSWVLSSRDLIVAFAVSFIPAHVNEVIGRVIGASSMLHYRATPENGWAQFVFDRVPEWLAVRGDPGVLGWFHEGLPPDQAIPWDLYLTPLIGWISFVAAIGIGCITLGSIMRRQWVEHERIPYPFARVIEELAGTDRGWLVRGRLFWAGFAVPVFIIVWYMIGYINPEFPVIRLGIEGTNYSLGRHAPPFRAHVYFPMVGFAYFTDLSVLLSIWLFYILTWIQIGFTSRLGFETLGRYAGTTHQGIGGYVVFCAWTVWMARHHLRDVFRQGLGRARVTGGELLSHKTSARLFLVCLAFMIGWLLQAGMQPLLAVAMVLFWFLFYTGFAKVVATTGLVFVESPGLGTRIVEYIPKSLLTPESMAIRRMVSTTYQNGKCFAAANAAYVARLAHPLGDRARQIGTTSAIGLILVLIGASAATIALGHEYGASNFGSNEFRVAPGYLNRIVSDVRNIGQDANYPLKVAYVVGGALTMAALTFARYRFTWWPVDPIGFTLVTLNSVQRSVLSVFLAWVAKSLILKLGGITLYRRWQPFFIGLIVGNATGIALGILVDTIYYPGAGHNLYFGD